MKFIDNRGMLFGKVNIIDFLVVIFVLSLTPMVWYGYRIFHFPESYNSNIPATITILSKEYSKLKNCEEEIAQKEKVFKKYPRLRRYFK